MHSYASELRVGMNVIFCTSGGPCSPSRTGRGLPEAVGPEAWHESVLTLTSVRLRNFVFLELDFMIFFENLLSKKLRCLSNLIIFNEFSVSYTPNTHFRILLCYDL
jgi:hypothetical protein